jgi:hypothetical protein
MMTPRPFVIKTLQSKSTRNSCIVKTLHENRGEGAAKQPDRDASPSDIAENDDFTGLTSAEAAIQASRG